MLKYHHTILIGFILFILPYDINAQSITLVDFGESAATTTFGLAGWNTVLKSGNIDYTAQGNGGLIVNSESEEYDDYRGVAGTTRDFSMGERIVVTWYNNSDETFNFTSRISFTDGDEPDPESPEDQWYTMRSDNDYRYTYTEILPRSTAKTVFNITDSGVHKTDESYSLVNINLAIEWSSTYQKQFLICEKIELCSDADITPPFQPDGLRANVLSDSKIQLNWNPSADDAGVVEYLIYMNGAIEGYSRSDQYTCVFLEQDKEYHFSISACDAAGNESAESDPVQATTYSFEGTGNLINPIGFEYLGAIALPEEFNWGGEAVAYYRDGGEGQTGSLFVTNVNQPENGLVGEVSLPDPVISTQKTVESLNQAMVLNQPADIRPSNVNNWDYVDIWRTGLEYIPEEGRLYSAWSIHYTVTEDKHASISCCSAADLAGSLKYGAWFVGDADSPPLDAMTGDWLFSVPQPWADLNCSGRNIVVGRCRDGGLSGLGPTMYAFSRAGSAPPPADSELELTTLLEYGSVLGTDNYTFPNAIDGYKHSDDWRDAMWLNAEDQNAVAVIGNKALGHNWYGYNGEWMRHDWVIADVPYPEFWETDPDGKGWMAHNQQPMIIFYDPADLAKTASGSMNAYEPQPYAAKRISKALFFGSDHEIFSAAFDSQNQIFYVTEFVRELEGRLILHAWRIDAVTTSTESAETMPIGFKLDQNYPNPFNSSTTIYYSLGESAWTELRIYDLQGREITTLVDAVQNPGTHAVRFDGSHLTGGIYFYRLQVGGEFTETKKMLLLK